MTDHARLVLFEDSRVRDLGPPVLTRPAFDLVAGAFSQRERLERMFRESVWGALVRPEITGLLPGRGLSDVRHETSHSSAVFVNAAWLVDSDAARRIAELALNRALISEGGRLLAFRTGDAAVATALATGLREPSEAGFTAEVASGVRVLRHSADLIEAHEALLAADIGGVAASPGAAGLVGLRPSPAEGIFVRGEGAFVEDDVRIDPPAAFDSSAGPILLRSGAQVAPFTTLEGPLIVGKGSRLLGGRVAQSYIGPGCLIRGEVAASVFLGWSNKAHDGFVGHSYFGEWVNLGAMTTTSNLKNTYGEIRVAVGDGLAASGRVKLGSSVGDHVKTAIGTLLMSGSAIGVGANLCGGQGPVPRSIPSFVWGSGAGATEYDFERMLAVTQRVMARRGRTLSGAERDVLQHLFAATTAERQAFIRACRERPCG